MNKNKAALWVFLAACLFAVGYLSFGLYHQHQIQAIQGQGRPALPGAK